MALEILGYQRQGSTMMAGEVSKLVIWPTGGEWSYFSKIFTARVRIIPNFYLDLYLIFFDFSHLDA